MRTSKLLEMLNAGKIDDVKKLLEDSIYEASLKKIPNAKKRYSAMKKYFTYTNNPREVLQKPCRVKFEDRWYTSFTNSWSLILTNEPTGEIELFDTDKGNYPDVCRLLRFDGVKSKIDISKIIAEAKSKGYKLTKSEVNHAFNYVLNYDGTYYKIGLLDISYGIIDNGKVAIVHHPYGERMPLTIQNDLGFCMLMPVKYEEGTTPESQGKIVIKVEL